MSRTVVTSISMVKSTVAVDTASSGDGEMDIIFMVT